MGAAVNHCFFVGNLGKEPEGKDINGSYVCNYSIAINKKWRKDDGTEGEKTTWVPCTAWGKQAKFAVDAFVKGETILVEGEFDSKTWEKDGVKHYKNEILVIRHWKFGEWKSRSKDEKKKGGAAHQGAEEDVPF